MRTPIKPSQVAMAGIGVLALTGAAFTNGRPRAPKPKEQQPQQPQEQQASAESTSHTTDFVHVQTSPDPEAQRRSGGGQLGEALPG
jgi:hypothetical protein